MSRVGRHRAVLLRAILVVGPLAGCWLERITVADEVPPRVAGLIRQLGADEFAHREAASGGLAAVGVAALGPLEAAMEGDDLEVASRAVEIVRGFLTGTSAEEADDAKAAAARLELATAAEQVLCRVAERADAPLAGFAIAALDFHHRGVSQESLEKLEELGARFTDEFSPITGTRGLSVTIGAEWRGTADDLRLVPRVRNVVQVAVRGVRLDDAAAAALGRVRGVERFEFYGTGIGDGALDLLRSRFPEARIDVRKGGKLGVGGRPTVGPCQITNVVDGSAADKAGLQINDTVLSIDGQSVPNFEALTEKVGKHGPGETLVLEVERSVDRGRAEKFTTRVVLDGWD
jgi:hypothetical protein